MRIRASGTLSILCASSALLAAAAISLLLRRDALRRDQAYLLRYQAQARLLGQVRAAPPEKQGKPALIETICVTDLDTFAGAVARRFGAVWGDPAQGVALLHRISALAVIGERHADAAQPPALPKRMGQGRAQPSGACGGQAYAEVVCDPALVATCPAAKSTTRSR